MGTGGIDPSDFRAAQEQTWGAAAAGWKEWSGFHDRANDEWLLTRGYLYKETIARSSRT